MSNPDAPRVAGWRSDWTEAEIVRLERQLATARAERDELSAAYAAAIKQRDTERERADRAEAEIVRLNDLREAEAASCPHCGDTFLVLPADLAREAER